MWTPDSASPLEEPIRSPFTHLDKGTYLYNRPQNDVYQVLIDTYRLRMADNFAVDGDAEPDSIYASATNDGLAGFRRFLAEAKQCVNGFISLMPPWFNSDKQRECETLAAVDAWLSLRAKITEADVAAHYGDQQMPLQLRMLGEFVWGDAPGGLETTAMRKALAAAETEQVRKFPSPPRIGSAAGAINV